VSFLQHNSFKYNNLEWLLLRLSFGTYWLYNFHWSIWHFDQVQVPVGIAQLINLNFLSEYGVKILFTILALVSLGSYLLGKYYRTSLSILFVISLLVFTAEESAGVFYRVSLLSMIWLAQLLALFIKDKQVQQDQMIFFSIQIISAAYLLAAFSKWSFSGLSWVYDAKYFDLQALKGDYFNWATDLQKAHLAIAKTKVQFVTDHLRLIQLLLALSLVLESAAILILRTKSWALNYGLALALMHLGIYLMMDIFIAPVAIPMFIFLVNPVYKGIHFFQIKSKASTSV
jgi:hypothetical protein